MKILLVEIGNGFDILATFPVAGIGSEYTVTVTAIGGIGVKSLTIANTTVTDSYSFTDNGDSTGTFEIDDPQDAGNFTITFRAVDALDQPFEKTFALQVAALPLTVTLDHLSAVTELDPADGEWTVTGGAGAITVLEYLLPQGVGISVSDRTVTLTGNVAYGSADDSPFAVSFVVEDALGNIAIGGGTMMIAPNLIDIDDTPLPDAEEGVAYLEDRAITGGGGGGYVVDSASDLPDGLSASIVSGDTLRISGTPDAGSSGDSPYSVAVLVGDGVGVTPHRTGLFESSLVVENNQILRSLRSKLSLAYDLAGDLNSDGRTPHALSGTAAWTTGPDGNPALASSGSAARFMLTNNAGWPVIDTRIPFALDFWIEHTSDRKGSGESLIFSAGISGAIRVEIRQSSLGGSTTPRPIEIVFGGQTIPSSANLPYNSWTHVVISSDGSTLRYLFDEVEVASASITPSTIANIDRWAIGTIAAAPAAYGYNLQYLRIYHGALTDEEIAYLYNSGNGRPASDFNSVGYGTDFESYIESLLVAGDGLWMFKSTSGTSVPDEIGSGMGALTGNNGAAMSGAILPPAGFSPSDGVGALDGTNDSFTIPSVNYTSGALEFTMSSLFYQTSYASTFPIVMRMGTVAGNANMRGFGTASADQFVFSGVYSSGGVRFGGQTANGSFTNNTWHQASIVWNGFLSFLMFDGYMSGGVAGTAPTASNLTNNLIGIRSDGTAQFAGYVKGAFIANRHALTATQLAKAWDLANGS